jgi:hypothetical protein
MEHTDRPPLTDISTSGLYRLKLTLPKFEKVKTWDDGTVSCRLFFVAADGKCLSKSYGTKYAGSLAMLVGKISGKYAEQLRTDATPAEFLEYLKPATGKPTDISVEVEADGEYQGRPRYKYKLRFGKGSEKPAAPAAEPGDDSVPF